MPEVHVTHDYDQPLNKVWAILGDFAGLASWLPGITRCTADGEGPGAIRTVITADGSQVRERLLTVGPARYSYRIIEAPGVDENANYVGVLEAESRGEVTQVTWSATFDADPAYPAEKVEKARQRAQQMYTFCLKHLETVLQD